MQHNQLQSSPDKMKVIVEEAATGQESKNEENEANAQLEPGMVQRISQTPQRAAERDSDEAKQDDSSLALGQKRSTTERQLIQPSKKFNPTSVASEKKMQKILDRQGSIASQECLHSAKKTNTVHQGPNTLSSIGKSVTVSSGQTFLNNANYNNANAAASSCNISQNTSTNRGNLDEEEPLQFTSEDEDASAIEDNAQLEMVDSCCFKRFVRHSDCISKSKYRTIHRGYDNESGCEIAWTTYPLHNYKQERLLKALDQVKQIGQTQASGNQPHRSILRVYHYEMRTIDNQKHQSALSSSSSFQHHIKPRSSLITSKSGELSQLGAGGTTAQNQSIHNSNAKELVVVSELITAGSIREYLKKIKTLRLNVIKKWCQKILEALQFLHKHDIVHGELSCESIYINSNNGEIKVGDVGIKHIHTSIRSHELGACKQYIKEKNTLQVDVFCFGLTLLEILAASEPSPSRFSLKYIIRILNNGQKQQLLDTILYEPMKDFLANTLVEVPEQRLGVDQLLNHPFLQQKTTTDNKNFTNLSNGLSKLIKYHISQKALHHQSKNSNSLQMSSVLNDSAHKKSRSSLKKSQMLSHNDTNVNATTSKHQGQHSSTEQPKQESMAMTEHSSIDQDSKRISSAALNQDRQYNSLQEPKPYKVQNQTEVLPDDKLLKPRPSIIVTRASQMSSDIGPSDLQKPIDPDREFFGIKQAPTSASAMGQRRQQSRVKHSKQVKARTTTLLEVPRQSSRLQYQLPIKQFKESSPDRHQLAQRRQSFYHRLRGKNGGFQSAVYPSAYSRSRRISSGTRNSTTDRRNSGVGSNKLVQQVPVTQVSVRNSPAWPEESKRRQSSELIETNNLGQVSQLARDNYSAAQNNLIENEERVQNAVLQEEPRSPEPRNRSQPEAASSPSQTTNENGNILYFRIQIMMKGKKSDVKFPFDLQKDTPSAVALELKDFFEQSGGEGNELPDQAIEAVELEIKRGIDCHYSSMTTNADGTSLAAQTQGSSYQNTVIIQSSKASGRSKGPQAYEDANYIRKRDASNDDSYMVSQQPNCESLAMVKREESPHSNQKVDEEKQLPIQAALTREMLEQEADRREQIEHEQKLAHDYLSGMPIFGSQTSWQDKELSYFASLEISSETLQPEQFAAAISLEQMHQMLQEGLLDEEEYRLRMAQAAKRKISISQNSNDKNANNYMQFEYYGGADGDYYFNSGQHLATNRPPDLIEEPATENCAAVIEGEPQLDHNNTTGERHEKMIQEQQKNGPFGRQDILYRRNSIEYNDPNLINFMHNPDDDNRLFEKIRSKEKKKRRQSHDSDKSEAQESLWLLETLFPGYAERYHEQYINNHMNTQHQHHPHLPHIHHLPAQPSSSTSQAVPIDTQTSQNNTIQLSFQSSEGPHQFVYSNKEADPPKEPFASDLSIILSPPTQIDQAPTQPNLAVPMPQNHEPTQKQTIVGGQVIQPSTGDNSSHLPSELNHLMDDQASQVAKNAAQHQVPNSRNSLYQMPNHRSFIQDCSESIIKDFVAIGMNVSGVINAAHIHLYKKDQHLNPGGIHRTPSLQTSLNMAANMPQRPASKLNHSEHCHLKAQMVTPSVTGQMPHNTKTSNTGTINEMPDFNHQTLSQNSAATTTMQEILQRTSDALKTTEHRNTFEVLPGSSQKSDSQGSGQVDLKGRKGRWEVSYVPHAIGYGKDQGQIQVISSSMDGSNHNQKVTSNNTEVKEEPLAEADQSGEKDANLMRVVGSLGSEMQMKVVTSLTSSEKTIGVIPAELPLVMTPSVVDLHSASGSQAESALRDSVRNSPRRLQTQVSIKGFNQAISENKPSCDDMDEEVKHGSSQPVLSQAKTIDVLPSMPQIAFMSEYPAGSSLDRGIVGSSFETSPSQNNQSYTHQQPATVKSQKRAFHTLIQSQDDNRDDEDLQEVSPLKGYVPSAKHLDEESKKQRFKQPSTFNVGSNSMTTKDNNSTVQQDLQRLLQIRERGMRGEKLEKGFGKMYKEDILNLKTILRLFQSYTGYSLAMKDQNDVSAISDLQSELSEASMKEHHFDRQTRTQVKKFKKKEGMTNLNTVDKQTWDKILESTIQQLRLISGYGKLNLESVQEQEEVETNVNEQPWQVSRLDEDDEAVGGVELSQNSADSGQRLVKEQSFSSLGVKQTASQDVIYFNKSQAEPAMVKTVTGRFATEGDAFFHANHSHNIQEIDADRAFSPTNFAGNSDQELLKDDDQDLRH